MMQNIVKCPLKFFKCDTKSCEEQKNGHILQRNAVKIMIQRVANCGMFKSLECS